MNKEIFNYLETVTQSLNIKNKDNLNKIYLQIISDENITTINLGNSSIDFENEVDYLIIKMDESTFFNLKDNKKHPEDLMFDEKIKIKGNLDLLK
uniref:MedDCM-OCT-S37-C10-cds26 n=1 Tax=Candidatus Actinomarina minuta TaxID=1389454 RepID=S5DKX8_9ACTN|nr:MedDCM-OCT-S37-C10-cds26 [Candidatus Actinomarina minuta]